MADAFVKAQIEILDKDARDPGRGIDQFMAVQFNPTDLTFQKGAQYAEIGIPGLDSPILQFVRGQNERVTLDLLFDTTDQGGTGASAVDVRLQTDRIYQLVKIQSKTHAPPRIRLTWGAPFKQREFVAVVESVQQRFSLFSPMGVPVRANVSAALREYKALKTQLDELNLSSPDHSKRLTVRRGDTLSRIAAREYGDPREWRRIAATNPVGTADLRRLVPGTVLVIPPIDDARFAGTGVGG